MPHIVREYGPFQARNPGSFDRDHVMTDQFLTLNTTSGANGADAIYKLKLTGVVIFLSDSDQIASVQLLLSDETGFLLLSWR
jgi:hypothetical protein